MATLRPIQSDRLYERIVQQIVDLILSNELKVNDKLPSEREMAERFHVSRTAVREAVKALRTKGLVEVYPGRGTFVTNSTTQVFRSSMELMLQIGENSEDLVEVRRILEPEIAAIAATRISEAGLHELQAALLALDSKINSAGEYFEADVRFHQCLAKSTGNHILLNLVFSLVDLRRDYFTRLFYLSGNADQAQLEHRAIVDAVARRDPEAARTAMCKHLTRVRQESLECSI